MMHCTNENRNRQIRSLEMRLDIGFIKEQLGYIHLYFCFCLSVFWRRM